MEGAVPGAMGLLASLISCRCGRGHHQGQGPAGLQPDAHGFERLRIAGPAHQRQGRHGAISRVRAWRVSETQVLA